MASSRSEADLGSSDWKADAEHRSAAGACGHFHFAAMGGHNVTADRHAQARPMGLGGLDGFFQNAFHHGGWETGPIVGDREDDVVRFALDTDDHLIGARLEGVFD